jgi:hypothetical protein
MDNVSNSIYSILDWTYNLKEYIKELIHKLAILNKELINTIYLLDSNDNKEVNKIKNRFYNKSVEIVIIKYFDAFLKKLKNINIKKMRLNISDSYNKFISSKQNNIHDFVYSIFKKVINIIDNIEKYLSYIIDIYLLRRILDKSYITNSIIYTGYTHYSDVIYILIKDFNFKITHIDKGNIKLITNIAKNNTIDEFISKLNKDISLHIYSDQCSNFKSFPLNFT